MTFGERLIELRKERGFASRSDFAEYIGMPSTTLRNYETNVREPGHVFLKQMSDIFHVSIDYLLCMTDDRTPPDMTPAFSMLELECIKKYRNLSPAGRKHVDAVLQWETEYMEQLKQAKAPATIIEFQSSSNENSRMVEYFRSASAGSGVFILGNEVAEQIAIPNTPENRAVDFAIKVSGDSMFPDYADGDIVLVSQKAELFHGDVGIFIINNNAYIKEYGEKELISRNPDAGNIQIAEYDNIVCMGKVIGKL